MDAEGGKGLSGPLTKANIAELLTLGDLENMFNRVGNVMPSKVVDTINESVNGPSLSLSESNL